MTEEDISIDPFRLEWTSAKVKELEDGLGLLHDKVHEDGKSHPLYVSARKWIPVSERLPKSGTKVLVYYGFCGETIMATYEDGKDIIGDPGWYEDFGEGFLIMHEVTHWLPLPLTPRV